jgi:hypothetical protein
MGVNPDSALCLILLPTTYAENISIAEGGFWSNFGRFA